MNRINKLLSGMMLLGGVLLASSSAFAIPDPPTSIGVHSAQKSWVQYWCKRYPIPGTFFDNTRRPRASISVDGTHKYKFGCKGFKTTPHGKSMILGCWKKNGPNNCRLEPWPPIKAGLGIEKPIRQMQ